MKKLALFLAALCISSFALAVEPNEMLKDAGLEARAREVSKQLRCVQCQNETIDESHADIARAMRLLVRERITAGDTNDQIIAYMLSRYGDYVLLRPRFMSSTLILWVGPFVLLVLGGLVVVTRIRRGGTEGLALTEEEQKAVAALTELGEGGS